MDKYATYLNTSALTVADLYIPPIPAAGAFVPLDYGSRYEYAVLFLPDQWESMWDMIAAPQAFFTHAQKSYSDTPKSIPKKSSQPPIRLDWNFELPDITIVVRPLTSMSVSTIRVLETVAPVNSSIQDLVRGNLDMSPADFRSQVIKACLRPNALPAPRVAGFGTAQNSNRVIHYVAEFALYTRILNIWYVPHDPARTKTDDPDYYAHRLNPNCERRFINGITPVTVNPVTNTDLTLIHFDCDFHRALQGGELGRCDATVGARRADFVMDFIENPFMLNDLFSEAPSGNGNSPSITQVGPQEFIQFEGDLTRTGNHPLLARKKANQAVNRPVLIARSNASFLDHPSVVIDCVKGNPVTFQPIVTCDPSNTPPDPGEDDPSANIPCYLLGVTNAMYEVSPGVWEPIRVDQHGNQIVYSEITGEWTYLNGGAEYSGFAYYAYWVGDGEVKAYLGTPDGRGDSPFDPGLDTIGQLEMALKVAKEQDLKRKRSLEELSNRNLEAEGRKPEKPKNPDEPRKR